MRWAHLRILALGQGVNGGESRAPAGRLGSYLEKVGYRSVVAGDRWLVGEMRR